LAFGIRTAFTVLLQFTLAVDDAYGRGRTRRLGVSVRNPPATERFDLVFVVELVECDVFWLPNNLLGFLEGVVDACAQALSLAGRTGLGIAQVCVRLVTPTLSIGDAIFIWVLIVESV